MSLVSIIFADIPSEPAALKCELPTPLCRGYASRQEAQKAACGGEKRKKNFRGTSPRPWQRAALCTPAASRQTGRYSMPVLYCFCIQPLIHVPLLLRRE